MIPRRIVTTLILVISRSWQLSALEKRRRE